MAYPAVKDAKQLVASESFTKRTRGMEIGVVMEFIRIIGFNRELGLFVRAALEMPIPIRRPALLEAPGSGRKVIEVSI